MNEIWIPGDGLSKYVLTAIGKSEQYAYMHALSNDMLTVHANAEARNLPLKWALSPEK